MGKQDVNLIYCILYVKGRDKYGYMLFGGMMMRKMSNMRFLQSANSRHPIKTRWQLLRCKDTPSDVVSIFTFLQSSTEPLFFTSVVFSLTDKSISNYSWATSQCVSTCGLNVDIRVSNPPKSPSVDLLHREPPQVKMTALMNSLPHSFTP